MQKAKIVAEIGCNHMGDFEIAQEMVKAAKICGADYVKFQKRHPIDSVPSRIQNEPHPNPRNAFGDTYLEHRKALEFDIDQHRALFDLCCSLGIGYASSVWDIVSAKEIISLGCDYIKIPSAMNNNFDLIESVYADFDKDVHVSLGMTTVTEQERLFNFLSKHLERTVFYWTTSGYPVPFDEVFLLEISRLQKRGLRIGYSGHHLGIAIDVAAYTLGATWIERHFTLDRTWKGTDHAASLEPAGLQKLCRDLSAVNKAFRNKEALTQQEIENMRKLR